MTAWYLFGLASGLIVSSVAGYVAWPLVVQRCRLPGETWDEARRREIARLDRLAEREEIPDTQRCTDRSVN